MVNSCSFLSSVGGIWASCVMTSLVCPYLWSAMSLVLLTGLSCLLRPDRACQLEYVGIFPAVGRTVSNKSSWLIWNFGNTMAVCRLSISDTDPACLGEGNKFMPSRALVSHLVNPPPPDCKRFWRAYTQRSGFPWVWGKWWCFRTSLAVRSSLPC